jgi:hypothetical protein
MGTLLLHDPCGHIFLLFFGALLIAFIWDCLHSPQAPRDDSRKRRPD